MKLRIMLFIIALTIIPLSFAAQPADPKTKQEDLCNKQKACIDLSLFSSSYYSSLILSNLLQTLQEAKAKVHNNHDASKKAYYEKCLAQAEEAFKRQLENSNRQFIKEEMLTTQEIEFADDLLAISPASSQGTDETSGTIYDKDSPPLCAIPAPRSFDFSQEAIAASYVTTNK